VATRSVANLVEFPVLPGGPADPNYLATSRAIELAFAERRSGEWKREAARSLAVAIHERERRIAQGTSASELALDRVADELMKHYLPDGMPREWAELAARKEARTCFGDCAPLAGSD
jgi:hypothetical protein